MTHIIFFEIQRKDSIEAQKYLFGTNKFKEKESCCCENYKQIIRKLVGEIIQYYNVV